MNKKKIKKKQLDVDKKNVIESAVFKRLVQHLQNDTNLQNIDLMNLAGFCRNCLAKWYVEEAKKQGLEEFFTYDSIREMIYGMPYDKWKKKYQKPLDPQ